MPAVSWRFFYAENILVGLSGDAEQVSRLFTGLISQRGVETFLGHWSA